MLDAFYHNRMSNSSPSREHKNPIISFKVTQVNRYFITDVFQAKNNTSPRFLIAYKHLYILLEVIDKHGDVQVRIFLFSIGMSMTVSMNGMGEEIM